MGHLALPGGTGEGAQALQRLRVLPVAQVFQGIQADDVHIIRIGMGAFQNSQGVHRVGGSAPQNLHVGNLHPVDRSHGHAGHGQPVGGVRPGALILGRTVGQHQQFFYVQFRQRGPGQRHMAHMHWVEGSSQDSYPHLRPPPFHGLNLLYNKMRPLKRKILGPFFEQAYTVFAFRPE